VADAVKERNPLTLIGIFPAIIAAVGIGIVAVAQ
jgi:hypothetical protein